MDRPYPSENIAGYGLPVNAVHGGISASGELALRYFIEGYLSRVPDDKIRKWAHDRTVKLIPFLADYFLASALGEARHWTSKSWAGAFDWQATPSLREQFDYIYDHVHGGSRTGAASTIWKKSIESGKFTSPADLARSVEAFFNHTPWNTSYGGPSWAYIAKFAAYLYEVNLDDYWEVLSAIDKAAHVAHTGASLMLAPKFPWFQTPHLGSIVQMAAKGDVCCWYACIDPACDELWMLSGDGVGIVVRRVMETVPAYVLNALTKYVTKKYQRKPNHDCIQLWRLHRSGGCSVVPTEQVKYTSEHPAIPESNTGICLCFRCGTRYPVTEAHCPRWCPECANCVDHADKWKEFHEQEKKAKAKGTATGESENDVLQTQEGGTAGEPVEADTSE